MSDLGMEHRWKVYIVRTYPPPKHEDWTTISAESRAEAVEKVAKSIAHRTGEWGVDPSRPAELIL